MSLQESSGDDPQQKIAIFDFDDTIAAVNAERTRFANPTQNVFGGKDRVARLDSMFRDLRSAGVILSICSFNTVETITAAMQMGVGNGAEEEEGAKDLFQYFHPDLIFGRDITTDMDMREKGVTVKERIMKPQTELAMQQRAALLPASPTAQKGEAAKERRASIEKALSDNHPVQMLFVDDKLVNCRAVASPSPPPPATHCESLWGLQCCWE